MTDTDVSGERDWETLETAAWHLDQANKPALATLVRDAATALRTPHGLPEEEELRRVIGEELECAPISDCDDCQYGEKGCCRNIARAILSCLSPASREDGK